MDFVFPQTEPNGMVTVDESGIAKAHYSTTGGMTLRDWFAGQALVAITHTHNGKAVNPSGCANSAYEYADAMLKARAKGEA